MAGKIKSALKDKISLSVRFPKYVGYADYYLRTPVSLQIKNDYTEPLVVSVRAESAEGLILPLSLIHI